MGVSRSMLPIVLAAGVVAAACPPALAAVASSDLTKLSYRADDGETNRVVLTWEGTTVSVRDPGVALVQGCVSESVNEVRCLAPSANPLAGFGGCDACSALISTGDGDDSGQVVNAPAFGLNVQLDGGAGDDTLSSDAGLGTVQGGPGNDVLTGHRVDGGPGDDALLGTEDDDEALLGGPGADAITGNGGIDTASYLDHGGPIRVTLDGAANDGARGERDDVRTENVVGGSGDDVLIGDDGANELGNSAGGDDELIGRGGPDTLIGGPDRDTLDGGAGDDTLLSFLNARGVVDEARCGAGEDDAQVSRRDRVALDCEHVYFGGTPVPRLAVNGPKRPRARRGVLRLTVAARLAEGRVAPSGVRSPKGPAIVARVTLRAVGGKPGGVLARARLASLAGPDAMSLALKLTTRARRELARRGRIRMRVQIGARDADGNESLTRRELVVRR